MKEDVFQNQLKEKPSVILKMYLLLGIVTAVLIGCMVFILFTGRHINTVNTRLIDAVKGIEVEAAKGHLWFEEIITGDLNESIETVYEHLDKAKWYAAAMLEGDESAEGKFYPLKEAHLREQIQLILSEIEQFRELTEKRWQMRGEAGVGSDIDEKFDAVFRELIQLADKVESELQNLIRSDYKNFQITQYFLIALCLIVFIIIGLQFRNLFLEQYRNNSQLISLNQQLDAANQQLGANEQQLKAANQQLDAANQQLKASNQQLDASNQQLRANEQQLKAANQQLAAYNQQLDAANQQLHENQEQLKTGKEKYRQLSKDLLVSEQFLKATNETAKVGGWEIDMESNEVKLSEEIKIIYELPPDAEPTLEESIDFVHPEDRPLLENAINHSVETGEPYDIEFRVITAGGNEIWGNGRGKPVKNGETVKMNGTFQDITKRKKAELERDELIRALAARNDELQSIVYISSHDLRSPLVNINGFSGALAESCKKIARFLDEVEIDEEVKKEILPVIKEDIPESLGFIRSSSERMSKLIDGLLRVSRIGTSELEFKKINMNNLISQITDTFKFKADSVDATITFEKLPDCTGDENQVTQIFANIIDNAVKYLDPEREGVVKISGYRKGGKSYYHIEDNGIGIAEDHLNKIFGIFHRLDPEGPVDGEGLGLTIVKRIIDRHNGEIRVESEEGKGTKFIVRLPS